MMGEIADECLTGFRCQCCACIMEDEKEPGYPRECEDCKEENEEE